MKVYIVMYMVGAFRECIGVYKTKEQAQHYIDAVDHDDKHNLIIKEFPLYD